ncbi:MAG: hypothetical protein J5546_07100 [Lachnospiraceae bacterium]|nr:hypothetical protein [Lachnospiraceae bacterium]
MMTVKALVIGIGVFIGTGFLAYVIEAIIFRNRGTIGTYESLFAYFRKVDQKAGNIAALVWAIIWMVLLVLAACFIYLAA